MNHKKQINQGEFIVLAACIMLLTAVAIDIMLPAFDVLREHLGLGSKSTATAQIITFFFLGQIGQLIFGPLSDRFGRIAILRLGFMLYISGSVVTAILPDLSLILAARFVVGMGAAAMGVSITASVRDRFAGDQMARIMSLILTIFLFVPILAPVIGSAILSLTSWQVVFLTPAIVATAVFFWSLRLNESLLPEERLPLDTSSLIHSARSVVGNRVFMRYTAISTILFSAFSSYVGSSERMISEIFGRPDLFVVIFVAVGITMAMFTFFNSRIVDRFGAKRAIRSLLAAYLLVASVLLGVTVLFDGVPDIYLFFVLVALLQGINVAVNPNSSALALEPMGSRAGMAAAINGTAFFVIGSTLGSFIDRQLVTSLTPLAFGYVVAGLIAVILVFSMPQRAAIGSIASATECASGD
ncbi:MAG: MFS transporter [Anaerolineae bacterium]|nr:MFS transporter [Anaerolineae bacterium]